MVMIRLAHASTLPQGEELVKLVQAAQQDAPSHRPAPTVQPLRPQPQATLAPAAQAAVAVKQDTRQADVPVAEAHAPALSSFAQILALAEEKRDIKFKNELERFVRPVRVTAGQIELALEPGAPAGLTGEISRKLQVWTGTRWMVLVARDGGEKTVAEQKKIARDAGLQEALAHPAVQAVLRKFPGSKIENVSGLPEAVAGVEVEDEEHS